MNRNELKRKAEDELKKKINAASGTPSQFGLRVKYERKARKITQQELGEKVSELEGNPVHGDAARVLISKIEHNVNQPSRKRMAIICELLSIDEAEEESMAIPMDAYAEMMTELTSVCSKLSPIALSAVLAYAKQFAEYGKEEKRGKPSTEASLE